MLIFNQTINSFIQRQKERLEEIRKETHLASFIYKVSEIYVSDNDDYLGMYEYNKRAIVLNKSLITMKQETVDHVLKHEYAHHCAMTKYGKGIEAHGKEFKEFCTILNIKPNAKVDIKKMDRENKSSIKEEAILEKVKKLFSLAESQNENEAKVALQKANELLTKHNLRYIEEEFEDIHQVDVYHGKQIVMKWRMIAHLLRELFDVYPVWSKKTREGVYLEINGTKDAVEIASYVSDFLDKEMELLFAKAKKEYNLKGRNAKHHYFDTLITSYVESVKKYQQEAIDKAREESKRESKELVHQEKTLAEKKEDYFNDIKSIVYGKGLRSTRYSLRSNQGARSAGRKDSGKLSIRSGLNKSSRKLLN